MMFVKDARHCGAAHATIASAGIRLTLRELAGAARWLEGRDAPLGERIEQLDSLSFVIASLVPAMTIIRHSFAFLN
jgi:hypothetical protein